MTDKIKVGAVTYRQRNGAVEWLLIRSKFRTGWEIPKSDARGGESSARAVIRFLKDGMGIMAQVVDEAARSTSSYSLKGALQEQKLVYYLMKRLVGRVENVPPEGKWFPYVLASRNLRLAKEQKILKQAGILLRECDKVVKSL